MKEKALLVSADSCNAHLVIMSELAVGIHTKSEEVGGSVQGNGTRVVPPCLGCSV